MAGALGIKIAGPRNYDGILVEDAWMGDGIANVEHERWVVKAVRSKVVVDVAVDHLG